MRKIVVTSGKGGVGKTTVTATLGRKLALQGYKVVLVDGDVGLNNLDVVTGIERRVARAMQGFSGTRAGRRKPHAHIAVVERFFAYHGAGFPRYR